MRKFGIFSFVFGLMAVLMLTAPEALAQTNPGSDLINDVMSMLTGNIGTLVGLGIALFGFYMWIVQQASWGIMVMIGGVALTAFPSIFEGMQGGFALGFADTAETLDTTNTVNNTVVTGGL